MGRPRFLRFGGSDMKATSIDTKARIDGSIGVVTGNNTPKRVMIEEPAVPGGKHVVALLVANAPLGSPVGAIFVRHVTMAFEQAPAQASAS